jgi:hypothetical protein
LAFYLIPLQRTQGESEREKRSKERRRRKKKRRKSKDLASSPLPIFDPVLS